MKVKWTLTLLFLLLFSGLSAQLGEVIDWDYEIDLLSRELAEKHPNLFFRTDSTWFYHAMSQVPRETPDKSLFQVSIQLQQVLAAMGDAHLITFYHFSDKRFPLQYIY